MSGAFNVFTWRRAVIGEDGCGVGGEEEGLTTVDPRVKSVFLPLLNGSSGAHIVYSKLGSWKNDSSVADLFLMEREIYVVDFN
jgi:hypothetical protein